MEEGKMKNYIKTIGKVLLVMAISAGILAGYGELLHAFPIGTSVITVMFGFWLMIG